VDHRHLFDVAEERFAHFQKRNENSCFPRLQTNAQTVFSFFTLFKGFFTDSPKRVCLSVDCGKPHARRFAPSLGHALKPWRRFAPP